MILVLTLALAPMLGWSIRSVHPSQQESSQSVSETPTVNRQVVYCLHMAISAVEPKGYKTLRNKV